MLIVPVPIVAGKAGEAFIKLCEKVLGVAYRPEQIKRIAKAEAEADVIRAQGENRVEMQKILGSAAINALEERAIQRFSFEQGKQQENIEQVIAMAIPLLTESAKPEVTEEDWTTNFFDKARLVSNEQMQVLWSRILAGEMNEPGTFSRRTVNMLQDLDKKNAGAFVNLCRFTLNQETGSDAFIYDETDTIYTNAGVNFSSIHELEALGLLGYSFGGYHSNLTDNQFINDYCGKQFAVLMPEAAEKKFKTGRIMFTQAGEELARLCPFEPVEGFAEYLVRKWQEYGYTVEELPSAEQPS